MMNGIQTIFRKSNRPKSKTPEEPSLQNTQCLNYYHQQLPHYPYPPNPYPPNQTTYHQQVYQPQQPLVQATIPVPPQSACLHHCQSQIIQSNTYQTHNNLRNVTMDPRPVEQSMMMNANNHMNGHIPQETQQQFVTTIPPYPNNMMQSVPIASQPSRCSENNFYINNDATLAYQQQQQQNHQQQQHQQQHQHQQQQHQHHHQHNQQQQQPQHNHQHQQHQLQHPSQVQKFQYEELRQRQQQQQILNHQQQVSQDHLELHQHEQQQQRERQQQQQQQHVNQQQYQNHSDLANGQSDEGLSLEVLSMMHDKDNEELEKLADGLKSILDNLSKELAMIRRGTPKYSVTEATI